MFKNDLHDKQSIDHALLKNMILLDETTKSSLYKTPQSVSKKVYKHELYNVAQSLKGKNHVESAYV
jgi:hypothetical protein